MGLGLIAVIIASVSFNAIAQVMLRKGMLAVTAIPPGGGTGAVIAALIGNSWLWAGLLSFGLSLALWLLVLARTPVSVAYPMASLGYIVAAALGVTFLGETVGVARALGLALICLGVFCVARTA